MVMGAFRLGTVNPQELHTSDTQPSSKVIVVSVVESKVSADRPSVVPVCKVKLHSLFNRYCIGPKSPIETGLPLRLLEIIEENVPV